MMLIVVVIIVVIIIAFYFFKNKGKAAPEPFKTIDIKSLLDAHIPYYQKLDEENKTLFEQKVTAFLTGITIEGVGTTVDDADRVMIASSAVIPIFGFSDWKYAISPM